jgi:hypothetical protein
VKISYNTSQVFPRLGIAVVFVFLMFLSIIVFRNTFLTLILILIFFTLELKILQRAENFIKGLGGEGDVVVALRSLPEEYKFINNVVLGKRGDIDLVVVGPTGIWALEVKKVRGSITSGYDRVYVRHFPVNYINQVWRETYDLKDSLKKKFGYDFRIQPVLVFSCKDKNMCTSSEQVKGVYVVPVSKIKDLVTNKSLEAIGEPERNKIVDYLKQYTSFL